MWTETTRPQYERKGLRYSSDVTDAEWLVISPHLPPRKRFGRPPKTAMRSIVDALLYMARTGCQWRLLPREFPPFTTVQNYFYASPPVGGRTNPRLAQSQPPPGQRL
jgi:transposase